MSICAKVNRALFFAYLGKVCYTDLISKNGKVGSFMLLLEQKRHGIHFYVAWFAKEPVKKPGIVTYHEAQFNNNSKSVPFDTLLTDLTETEEEIKQHFSKSCKYKINRAMRENIAYTILKNEEITDGQIKDFCVFFKKFWESKDVSFGEVEKLEAELKNYRKKNALSIAYASMGEEKAVYHVHIMDDACARLLHSASLYRLQNDDDGNTKNLIGMANRCLHFEEIKYFKSIGLSESDWGGAGTAEDVASITEFKKSFGGTPMQYYDFEEVNGIKAKMFKLLAKILKR